MGEWTKQFPIDYSPTGDTTSQAIKKHMDELDRIYNLLNRVRKLDAGDSPPTDPVTYHLWLDTSGGTYKLKIYDGSDWVDILTEIFSSESGTVTIPTIFGPNGGKYDTTITLTAIGSLTAYKDNKAVIDHYEWQLPNGTTVTGDSIDYVMPGSEHVGETLIFKCRAVDNLGNVSPWVNFTVEVSNDLPAEINSVDREEVLVGGKSYTFTIDASDPAGRDLQYKITCNDSRVVIDPSDWSDNNSFTITLPDYVSDTPVVFTYHVNNGSITTTKADFVTIYANLSILGLIDSLNNLYLSDIAVDSNGNIFVCGYWYNGGDYDFYIAKFDKNLNPIKQITVDRESEDDRLMGIAIDSNNNVFVCGFTHSPLSDRDNFYIAKLDNDLNFIEQIIIDGDNNDGVLLDIAIDSEDNVFVCGYWYNGSNNDFYIAKFDNDLNIVKQITLDSGGDDYLYGLAIDSYDNIFVCGSKGHVIKLNNSLTIQNQVYLNDYFTTYAIAIDNDNNVLVANRYYVSSSNNNLRVTRFDSNLNLIRQQTIDKEPASSFGLCVLPDGNVCMVTMIEGSGCVFKMDKFFLSILKQCGINKENTDFYLTKVCSDNDGNIYICGHFFYDSYTRGFVAKLVNFENYNGTIVYTLGEDILIKYDTDYALNKAVAVLNSASLSATDQSWSPTAVDSTVTEQDFTVYTDIEPY